MGSIEQTHSTEQTQRRIQRYTRLEKVLTVILTTLMVVAIIIVGVAFTRQNALQDSQERLACVAHLTADFQAAVGDALAAPPAPNAERLLATHRIAVTSKKLHDIEKYC